MKLIDDTCLEWEAKTVPGHEDILAELDATTIRIDFEGIEENLKSRGYSSEIVEWYIKIVNGDFCNRCSGPTLPAVA